MTSKSERLAELVAGNGGRPDVDVDWADLPDYWRGRNHRLTRAGETRSQHANIVRAQVAEGIIEAEALRFAADLDEQGD